MREIAERSRDQLAQMIKGQVGGRPDLRHFEANRSPVAPDAGERIADDERGVGQKMRLPVS